MPNSQVAARKKRFILRNNNKRLKGFWLSREGEPLTITYHYSKEMLADSEFIERVNVAAKSLNSLQVVHFIYKLVGGMGVCAKNATLGIRRRLQKKYNNTILIERGNTANLKGDISVYCSANIHWLYTEYRELFLPGVKDDPMTLPPFATISCAFSKNYSRNFNGGLLIHEFFHLLGLDHSHGFSDTNGILSIQGYIPDILSIKKGGYEGHLYAYDIGPQFLSYTPLSLFSIQHYRLDFLAPIRVLNKTRVIEILTEYQFSSGLQRDYFYLLEKYAGYPYLLTYQDLSALVRAVYVIAPRSMLNRVIHLPYYHFISGIYISTSDKERWVRLLKAFQKAENFSYPILAKENLNLNASVNHIFSESLIKLLRIVHFEGKGKSVVCSLQGLVDTSVELRLGSDCTLIGRGKSIGGFEFNIDISNGVRIIQRTIRLNIVEKTRPKNHILLGKKHTTYLFNSSTSIDLIDLCQAAVFPVKKSLQCRVLTESFRDFDSLAIDNCLVKPLNRERDYTLQVKFFNGKANKACRVELVSSKDPLDWSSNSIHAGEGLVRSVREAEDIASFVVSAEDNKIGQNVGLETAHPSDWPRAFHYLLTIPFSHGVFEAFVDSVDIPVYAKGLFLLVPRIGLFYFGYFSVLGFALVSFATLIENVIKANMPSIGNQYNHFIQITGFLILSELEYGFSHLWELADRVEFWPALSDKLNLLFTQVLWAPIIKTLGYLLTLELIASCPPWPVTKKETVEVETFSVHTKDISSQPELKGHTPSFFNAIRVAVDTVFSKKIRVVCPFFSWKLVNRQPEETVFRLKAPVIQ